MVSDDVCRKIKAILFMAMLAGAEVHQARYNAGPTFTYSATNGGVMSSPAVETHAQRITEQMNVMMGNPTLGKEAQRVTKEMEGIMTNADFQSRTKRITEQMEAMMADQTLQNQAKRVYEKMGAMIADQNSEEQMKIAAEELVALLPKQVSDEIEAMMADTTLQKQANSAAEQVKTMQADQQFKDQAKQLAEDLEAVESDPSMQEAHEEASRLTERVEAMMSNPRMQERSANLVEEMEAVKTDSNLNAKAKGVAERMEALAADPHYANQVKLVGEKMEAMMANTDSQEHVQSFEKQLMVMMAHPDLQEHKKLLKQEMKAMWNDQTLQEHMQHFQEHISAMKADAQFQKQAKGLSEQMAGLMAEPENKEQWHDDAPGFEGRRLAEEDTDTLEDSVDSLLEHLTDKLWDRSAQEETAPTELEHATLGKQGMPASSPSASRLSVSTAARGPVSRLAAPLPLGLRLRQAPLTRKPWSHVPQPAASRNVPHTIMSMGGDDDTPQGTFTKEEIEFFEERAKLPFKNSKRIDALEGGWGSALLVLGTIFSMALANSQFGPGYIEFWETAVGYGPAAWHLTMPLREWVNEMVMAFFFFLVGLEIKQEFLFGSLADMRKAALPCIAALGGMVVPAGIYCAVQMATGSAMTGWAIPMATDIAFAMGVYNVFAKKLPAAMSAFLLTLATVDDLGAIAVIAVFFAKHINAMWLAGAAGTGVLMEVFRRQKVRNSKVWALVGAGLWYCLLRGGVNADVAGVLTAFAIPAVAAPEHTKAMNKYPNLLNHFIHYWVGWANFLIMPLFAIANTAVALGGVSASAIAMSPKAQGIMAGLLLGKPLGIAGASLAALSSGLCKWPEGLKPKHLWLSGMLGGIAFTMSLFLIEQSLTGPVVMAAKLAVIVGSTAAALIASAGAAAQPDPASTPPPLPAM